MRVQRTAFLIGCLMVAGMIGAITAQTWAKDPPPKAAAKHRVLACYFHRTNRCPTCKKISAYIEESLKAGFDKEMKAGAVELRMIDFQDPKNEEITSYYEICNPTLVIMDVRDDKVSAWKPAPKVWSLVGKKDAFFKYVQDEVRAYLNKK